MEVHFTATYEKTVDFIIKLEGKHTKEEIKKMVESGDIFDEGKVLGEEYLDEVFLDGALNEIIETETTEKKGE